MHLTPDLANLSLIVLYNGEDSVTVGNGQTLPITHTGSGILPTSSHTFQLSSILYSPCAFVNLLSVYQCFVDNNCVFIFDYVWFLIQDKAKGKSSTKARVKMVFILFSALFVDPLSKSQSINLYFFCK